MILLRPCLLLASGFLASPVMAGDLAFITSQNGNAVSVVDLEQGQVLASADVPDAPAPVAYDPGHGRAYVIAADTGRLHVLNKAAETVDTAELGEGAFGLAVAPEGGLFVTNWFGATLTRLDADLTPLWQVPTGAAPAGVAVSDDGRRVATADRDADAVSIFDAKTGQRLHQVATAGSHPFGITFEGGRFFTADVQSDSVSVIDAETGRLIGSIPTGSHPYGVAFASGRGFVTNQYHASLTVFDASTFEVLAEVDIGDYPEGIAALPDGSGVVIANWDSDEIVTLDAVSLEIRHRIEMPAGPRAFGQFTGRQVPQ
ncbi:YncE family protein [Paracoccus sp. (in: a-proteobacteria)]|uniref:YncE family protein n=1 Tax=Paracoccus sp. TaxID=267 RepID=UPI00396CC08E